MPIILITGVVLNQSPCLHCNSKLFHLISNANFNAHNGWGLQNDKMERTYLNSLTFVHFNHVNPYICNQHHITLGLVKILTERPKQGHRTMATKGNLFLSGLNISLQCVNTLRPGQNGHHSPYDMFKCIFWMKIYQFGLRFYWSLFVSVQLTTFHYWFR